MPAIRLTLLLLFLPATYAFAKGLAVSSPDKKITFTLDKDATHLIYRVSYQGELLIDNSHLALSFKLGGAFGNDVSFDHPSFQK